jgi:hypothetical protein
MSSVIKTMKRQSKRTLHPKNKKQIVFKLKLTEFMWDHWLKDLKMKITNMLAKEIWWLPSLVVIINVVNIDLNPMIVVVLMFTILSLYLAISHILLSFIILDLIAVIILLIILCHLLILSYRLIIYHLMLSLKCFIDILLIIIIDTHRIFIVNNL